MSDHSLCPACGFELEPIEERYDDGAIVVSLSDGCTWRGHRIPLSRSELAIVHTLVAARGSTIKREAIENILDTEPLSNSITVLICRIRKAFVEADPEFDRIITVPCLGYRWRGE